MAFDLGDYKDVAARIEDFAAKHPEGSLRPLNPDRPYDLVEFGGKQFVVYVAAAFRTPDDPAPGVGVAWEPFPGTSNYTRNSELQNAETSAWGRAIVAVLASQSKAIASQEDVRNRQADTEVELAPEPEREEIQTRLAALPEEKRQKVEAWLAKGSVTVATLPASWLTSTYKVLEKAEAA